MKAATPLLIMIFLFGCTTKQTEYDLIVSNVNLIDGTGAPIKKGMNVYIRDKVIQKIDSEAVTASANLLDGSGKYLIPGLFDGHFHTVNFAQDFSAAVHYGVTSVFVPGGSNTTNEVYSDMRLLGAQDILPAPRVFHTSQHFTMEGRHPVKTYASSNWREGETVFYLRDTAQIAQLVHEVSAYPIAGIKLTIEDGPTPPFVSRMPQLFVNKVAEEASKRNLDVFVHVSDNLELQMAIDAGITNIVHFTGVDLDWNRDSTLINQIEERDLSWVTTLMIDKSFFYPLNPDWAQIPEIMEIHDPTEIEKLRDPSKIEQASQFIQFLVEDYGIEDPTIENLINPQVEDIRRLYEEGVNMVLGTDTGNDFIFPGYSLHEEMQLLEMGGMEPSKIIKMGTLNAAKMLNVSDSLGTIAVGKYADMIMLDENPLKSIRHTLSISHVIKNGVIQRRIGN